MRKESAGVTKAPKRRPTNDVRGRIPGDPHVRPYRLLLRLPDGMPVPFTLTAKGLATLGLAAPDAHGPGARKGGRP
jgi:hypothetical protein